jgi:long-chain acyl-CoA synthetase
MITDTYPKTIQEFLSHLANYGSNQALATHGGNDDTLTYSEVIDRISLVAANLKAHGGLKTGDRIMLYGLAGPDWVVAFFACLLAGYIAVPVDVRMSSELVGDLLKDTDPKLIVIKNKIGLKTKANNVRLSQLLKPTASHPKLESFNGLNGDTIAEIILTSGTWSQPKGVTLTHKNLLSNLAGVDSAYNLAGGAKLLSILPLSHAYEQMVGLFVPLYRGAAITYITEIRADVLTSAISEHGITMIVAVPRILELLRKGVLKKVPLSKRIAFEKVVIHSRRLPVAARRKLFAKVHKSIGTTLRTFTVGGAPLESKLDHFFQGLGYIVLVGYGLSETAPVLSISLDQGRVAGSVGQPLGNVSVELKNDGEVVARGDNVFHGYWPKQHKNRHFSTGDLGRFDKCGNLILVGRSKNLVIFSSGDKIFLEDIEKIADGLEGIEESCAANLGDDSRPHIHLFVVIEGDKPDQFKESINAKLPFGVRIRTISKARIEVLPRTHTLKLSRKQIIDQHAEDIEELTARSS